MSVNREQAQMIAALAIACRPHGSTHWDAAGVMAEVGKVKDRQLADVILAVIRAADDRTAKTPGVISAPGSQHWKERGTTAPRNEPYDRGGTCSTCSLPAEKCRAVWRDDHPYISVHEYSKTINKDPDRIARILQAVRDERAPMREPAHPEVVRAEVLDHDHCEENIAEAGAQGKPGRAEWLATRCDRTHGIQRAAEESA